MGTEGESHRMLDPRPGPATRVQAQHFNTWPRLPCRTNWRSIEAMKLALEELDALLKFLDRWK